MKKIFLSLLAIFTLIGGFSSLMEASAATKVVNATSVKLSKTALTLDNGRTATLTATVNPTNATNKTVTWTSSNTSIATVSKGKVTAKAKGIATITAKTSNGKKATCKVTVKQPVTSIKLDTQKVSWPQKETFQLKATVNPSNANDKTVTWISSNTKIATVSYKGIVACKSKGTTTITAKSSNGKTATCKLTVTDPIVYITNSHKAQLVKELEKEINNYRTGKTIKVGNTYQEDTKGKYKYSCKISKKQSSLTVSSTLKSKAGTRANELLQKRSHIRPNGKSWCTVYTGNTKALFELKGGAAVMTPDINAKYLNWCARHIVYDWHKDSSYKSMLSDSSVKYYGIGVSSEQAWNSGYFPVVLHLGKTK